jgi:hypothetical protein
VYRPASTTADMHSSHRRTLHTCSRTCNASTHLHTTHSNPTARGPLSEFDTAISMQLADHAPPADVALVAERGIIDVVSTTADPRQRNAQQAQTGLLCCQLACPPYSCSAHLSKLDLAVIM